MITIQHNAKQFELHLKLSTEWLHKIGKGIAVMLDFSDIKTIQKQKEQIMREFGHDFLKIN